jgi:hypothetical protein
LLKDKDGRIDLEVPIEGSVDAPEFAYRKVFWQAVKKILTHVATAPFRALGRMFGMDDADLELVDFDPGRSDLIPPELDKLVKLAEELGRRPELTLEVEGRFDATVDAEALRRDKLDRLIASRREATAAAIAEAAEVSTLETILESLFAERFSPAELDAERARFTAAVAAPPEPEPAEGKRRDKDKKKARSAPPPPASPPATAGAFDAAAFYDALQQRLLEAQTVDPTELAALGGARAASIVGALTASGLVDVGRVSALDPAPVKRRKAGSTRVASEMSLSARGEARTAPDVAE